MKNQEVNSTNTTNYAAALSVVIKRQNGTPAGLAALQVSLNRGKELIK